jgi:predicted DNA-binding ribbon-helix-helix protein
LNRDITRIREAAAEYWDAHTIDEADGDVVDVEVAVPLTVLLSIRLDAERYSKLKRIARKRGLTITSMAKERLVERLDQS